MIPSQSSPGALFLIGVLAAWATAQVANAAFFALAWALGRRERDYLSFSALCLALAVATAAIAWGYWVATPEAWLRPSTVAHAGTISATAFNLHFVLRFVSLPRSNQVIAAGYLVALCYLAFLLLGDWWLPGSVAPTEITRFGVSVVHMRATPSVVAASFYLVAGGSVFACAVLVLRAFWAGRREALTPCVGLIALGLAVVNDSLVLLGKHSLMFYLLPHAFMIYAFGFASTLLFRYGRAAGALEQAATDLERTTEELRHSHAELVIVQGELEHKRNLATVGELAAAIAHEVRNPLAIIMNAVAGLRRNGLGDSDRATLLDIVNEETARLNRLVTDLLRFARPVNVECTTASLLDLAQRTQSLATEHRVVVSAREGAPTHVLADPALLRLAIDNLVENACQAMPTGGDVHIVIDRDPERSDTVRIQVSDTGHGMSDDVLSRALDPFFTTRPSGTGLGLPIVQRIAEAHSGKLTIETTPSEGTTATLHLPVEPGAESERRS